MTGYSPYSGFMMPDRDPFQPFDQFGGATQNPFIGMGLQMAGGFLANQTNMVPTGFGRSNQNLYDNLEHQRRTAMWRNSLAGNRDIQAQIFADLVAGVQAHFSDGQSQKEREAMKKQIMWMADMAPEELLGNRMVDRLTGGLNVIGMSGQIYEAGANQIDPVTGLRGLSANTSAQLAGDMFNRYFTRPEVPGVPNSARQLDPNYMFNTRGFTAMDLGDVYRGMSRRGMFADSRSERQRAFEAFGNLDAATRSDFGSTYGFDPSKIQSASDITDEMLGNMQADSRMQAQLRGDSIRKVGDQMDGYLDALAAVKELFVESGNSNPTIPELLAKLDEIGAASGARFSGTTLAGRARYARNIAELNQISVAGAEQYMQLAQQQVQAAGGSGVLGFDVGAYALSTRASYASGAVDGNFGFNSANVDEQAGFATRRAASAATSKQAARLGVLMRLADRGALTGNMAGLADRLRNGLPIPENILNMSESQFTSAVASSANMSTSLVDRMIDSGATREVEMYNLTQRVATEGQRNDATVRVREEMSRGMNEAAISDLGVRSGRDRDRLRGTIMGANRAFVDAFAAGGAEAMDPAKRMAFVQKFLKDTDNAQVRDLLAQYQAKYGDEKGLNMLTQSMMGNLDVAESEVGRMLGDERGLSMLFSQTSREAMLSRTRINMEANIKNQLQGLTAGGAGGTFMQNAAKALIEAGQDNIALTDESAKDVTALIASTLGYQDKENIGTSLATIVEELNTREAGLQEQLKTATGDDKAMIEEQLKAIEQTRARGISVASLLDVESEMSGAAADMAEGGGGNITANNVIINIDGVEFAKGFRGEIQMSDASRNASTPTN